MAYRKRSVWCLIAAPLLLSLGSLNSVWAQTAPAMGTARNFAVLGASTVTNTGPSSLIGRFGRQPGFRHHRLSPRHSGWNHSRSRRIAAQAQVDAAAAYNTLVGETCTTNLTGQDLGGLDVDAGRLLF